MRSVNVAEQTAMYVAQFNIGVPEMKPSSAIRCAFEISMPCGFMASTADAEKVEADRMAVL